MKTIEAGYGRLVVKVDERKSITDSGIVIPESVQSTDTTRMGKLVSIGPRRKLFSVNDGPYQDLVVGQHIILSPFGGVEIVLDKEKFLVITEDDILGTLKEV